MIEISNKTINKIYSETKDFIETHKHLVELEQQKHRDILESFKEQDKAWNERNYFTLSKMRKIREAEINRIEKSDEYIKFSSELPCDKWITHDFYLCVEDYGTHQYHPQDLCLILGSDEYKKEYEKLLKELTPLKYKYE